MLKESIILPSMGYPYKDILNSSSVFVKPITTRIYKDFLINNSDEGVLNLIDSCLVDCPLKAEDLTFQDELAVYLKIRCISLGANLQIASVCPHCKQQVSDTWNLMDLECTYLVLDEYPFKFILPDSKVEVTMSLPTSRSQRLAREEAQKRATRFDKKLSDFLPVFSTVSVLSVSEAHDIVSRYDWYNKLSLKDAIYIDQVAEKLQDFGISVSKETECDFCKKKYRVPLTITPDFFRPSVGDITGITTSTGTLEKGPTDTEVSV